MIVENITRGGQTWAHRMRMLRQVLRIQMIGSVAVGILFFASAMLREPKKNYQASYYYCLAHFPFFNELVVDGRFWDTMTHQKTQRKKISVKTRIVKTRCKEKALALAVRSMMHLRRSSYASLGAFFSSSILFAIKGILDRKKKILRKNKEKSNWKTRFKMFCLAKRSAIKLGSVHLLKHSETRHMLICGATGTGKTTALKQLIHQIRKRGDRAVVVDTTGEFLQKFFQKKDILLNPYDERSANWHPWCECTTEYDFERIVNSIVPHTQGQEDDFFVLAARTVILAALEKTKDADIQNFVNHLLKSSVAEIYEKLKDTNARIYVDPKGEKTTVSIRATIANHIRPLSILKNSKNPFSIRDWVLSDDSSWLFFSYEPDQRESLNPLATIWFSIAKHALTKRSPTQYKEKIWLIIDELHSLRKIEHLEDSLAELRKYGGAVVLATQNISQLYKIYGHHGARIILDQCGTKVSFRQSDAEIAKMMSNLFGQREITEKQEGISYGAHEMRDGVTLSSVDRVRANITPTQIMTLPDLQAFIKLPGNWAPMLSRFKVFKKK